MSEHVTGPSRKYFIASIALAAVVATFFGFLAGLIGANPYLSAKILSSLSPELGSYLGAGSSAVTPAPGGRDAKASETVSEEDALIRTVEKTSPAVVSIVVSKDMPVYEQYFEDPFGENDFFRQFFEGAPGMGVPQYRQKGTEQREVGAGSGFLVSDDGYIVTNKHVVVDEKAEYTVILQDGRKLAAQVLARDSANDIAVLKIDGAGFPFIPFGDSDKIRVGQHVLAIGYALGRFGNTVSTGIVSGLSRSITAGDGMGQAENLFDVIQTDAAINPGNSGGPLLDLRGEAIGVNVAIVQGSQNIGFALPINDVKNVVESVKAGGKISRAFLGVRYVMINEQIKQANTLTVDDGALIVHGSQYELAVMPGSPADIAGLVENDIILEVNGKKLTEEYPLALAIRRFGVGDKLQLKVLSKGKERAVEVTLQEKPQ